MSLISSGIVTRALSIDDKSLIPFVELATVLYVLTNKVLLVLSWLYKYLDKHLHW